MSRPPEYEHGTPQGPPNVYHPQPDPAPSYEEYADPAVAHGWLNAYDETREMSPVVDETYVAPPLADRPSRRKPKRAAGRRGNGRRSSGGPWGLVAQFPAPLKGAVVAGGVVGALIVGFSFAGSSSLPSGGAQGKKESTAPKAPPSESSAGVVAGPSSGSGAESAPAASPSPSVSPSRTASASEGGTREPSAGTSTTAVTATPAPTASASGPGRSGGNPGHGQGGTKGPKQP